MQSALKQEKYRAAIYQMSSIERLGEIVSYQQEHQDEINEEECKDLTLQDYTIVHLQVGVGKRQL